jgi:hypothetical protein
MDPEWSHDRSQRSLLPEAVLRQFENETGVRVIHLVRELLRGEMDTPDVIGVDAIWPGLLDDALLDLKPLLSLELSAVHPDLVKGDTVNNRVVAVPYHPHVGDVARLEEARRKVRSYVEAARSRATPKSFETYPHFSRVSS